MNTHPIFGQMINGMMEAQRLAMPSPGLEAPRPNGCPSCAAAEAQCDRMAQRIRELEAAQGDIAVIAHQQGWERAADRIRELEAALELEAKARYSMAEGLAEAKQKLAWYEGNEAAHRVILRQAKMDRDQAREDAQTAKLAQAQAEAERDALLALRGVA